MVDKIVGMGKISTKNQVTIPKDVMETFKLKIGDKLLFMEESGKIVIRKA
jgi:AbrB family looped-hinge helix DNA binding protein